MLPRRNQYRTDAIPRARYKMGFCLDRIRVGGDFNIVDRGVVEREDRVV